MRARPIAKSTHGGVLVVIPSYHGGSELLGCLSSLETCVSADTHILVVDNASTDSSIDAAQEQFGWIEFIRNSHNVGFGSACNQGIQLALDRGDEFVLLINQDTRVAPDLIERLIAFAKETPGAGVIGAKTLSFQPMPDGSPRLLYAGAWKRCLPLWQKIPGIGKADRCQAASPPVQVDYVWGHGMFLRTAAMREVGLFDPGFFMYYEDLDLCLRMKEAGWDLWCEPKALMWHDVEDGPRAKKSDGWRWNMKMTSARHFFRKRHSNRTAELLLFVSVVREAASLARDRNFQAVRHLVGAWGSTSFARQRKARATLAHAGSVLSEL